MKFNKKPFRDYPGIKNYWSQEDCQQSFADEGMKVHYTMMCALGTSTPATDACNGDSGGALYDKKKDKVSNALDKHER
jgi:secreted trypsin-like serine protease